MITVKVHEPFSYSQDSNKGDTYLSSLTYLIKDQTMISKQGRIFLTFLHEKMQSGVISLSTFSTIPVMWVLVQALFLILFYFLD